MLIPAGKQLEDEDDPGNDEDDVYQPAENIEQEANQPECDQNQYDPPKDFAHDVTRFPSCLLTKSYPPAFPDKPGRLRAIMDGQAMEGADLAWRRRVWKTILSKSG